MRRGLLLASLVALALPFAAPAAKAPAAFDPELQTYSFSTGTSAGTALSGSSLVLGTSGLVPFAYTDPHGSEGTGTYDSGTWTSEWRTTTSAFTQAVASWIADTPAGTWVQVEFQARTSALRETKWYVLGRWAYDDATFHRTSLSVQGDADGFVAIDTFVAAKKASPYNAYRTRLTLLRRAGKHGHAARRPVVRRRVRPVGELLDRCEPDDDDEPRTPGGSAVLAGGPHRRLPAVRQRRASLVQPDVDVDGAGVLARHGRDGLPGAADYAYVYGDLGAAIRTRGSTTPRATSTTTTTTARATGRSTSRTPDFGLTGAVTQLRSLAEAEEFVRAASRSVISIAFGSGKLDGAPIKSTDGHLMVIAGFEANGDPIVNDPAAHPARMRSCSVYDRAQFERRGRRQPPGSCTSFTRPAGRSRRAAATGSRARYAAATAASTGASGPDFGAASWMKSAGLGGVGLTWGPCAPRAGAGCPSCGCVAHDGTTSPDGVAAAALRDDVVERQSAVRRAAVDAPPAVTCEEGAAGDLALDRAGTRT